MPDKGPIVQSAGVHFIPTKTCAILISGMSNSSAVISRGRRKRVGIIRKLKGGKKNTTAALFRWKGGQLHAVWVGAREKSSF